MYDPPFKSLVETEADIFRCYCDICGNINPIYPYNFRGDVYSVWVLGRPSWTSPFASLDRLNETCGQRPQNLGTPMARRWTICTFYPEGNEPCLLLFPHLSSLSSARIPPV